MGKVRNVIVTGASRGIGKAIAEEFVFRNKRINIALISRHYDNVAAVVEEFNRKYMDYSGLYEGNYFPFECNVANEKQAERMFREIFKRFGSIDVLVNNAGINSRKILDTKNIERWFECFEDRIHGFDEEIATNLRGSYICSYLCGGYMLKRGNGGSIINISSVKGIGATSSIGYGASKAGVIKLTKDFAKALAPYGIRVNCIAPGFIDTGMTSELHDEKKAMYKALIPENRFGSVEEVAKTVAFLASDEASYITGAMLLVDGGYLMC